MGSDPTIYRTGEGVELSTKERVVKDVAYPEPRPPTDDKSFIDKAKCIVDTEFSMQFFKREGRLTKDQAHLIIDRATEVLSDEPNLSRLDAPITVCGDIHGQYYDSLKLFEVGGPPETTRYSFMGDYVDRGYFSIECLLSSYSMKLRFPNTFWLLRGNHECRHLTNYFTFKRECTHKYDLAIYDACMKSFDALPLAAIMNKQFFCVHGGISPELNSLDDLIRSNRFREPPTKGLSCDSSWADPHEEFGEEPSGTAKFIPNSVRGCSYFYTYAATQAFLKKMGLLSVIRAHEAQDAGYRTYRTTEATGFPAVMTIFSAPNYLDAYNNKAAVSKYENNVSNIRQFNASPHPYWSPNFMDVFTWSLPFVGEKISEMLMAILNTCTREELDAPIPSDNSSELVRIMASASVPTSNRSSSVQEQMVSPSGSPDLGAGVRPPTSADSQIHSSAASISSMNSEASVESHHSQAPSHAEDERGPVPDETSAKFRNKVLAIARISRMFSVLREESELISEFKGLTGTQHLPKGTLMLGSQGIRDCIHNFEDARKADLQNESLPPVQSEEQHDEEVKLRRHNSYKRQGSTSS